MTTNQLLTRTLVLRRLAAATMAGAAVIHLGVMADHFREWWAAGTFFLVVGVAQLVWALLVWTSPVPRRLLWAGIGGNALVVLVWLVSRTTGLPFGPDAGHPEAVGTADVVCVILEIAGAALALALVPLAVRERAWTRAGGASTTARLGMVTAAAGVLVLVAAGGALAVPEPHSDADDADMGMASTSTGHGEDHGSGTGSMDGERHAMPNLPDAGSATAAQTAAARRFLEESEADTAAYRDLAKAKAAGFDVAAAWQRKEAKATRLGRTVRTDRVQLVHVPSTANRSDGRVLDPKAPETLMYARSPKGTFTLVGIMYTAEKKAPPNAYPPYQRWHYHEKCVTRTTGAKPTVTEPTNGTCPDGATLRKTGYMTHLWFVSPDQLTYAYAMNAPMKRLAAYQQSLTGASSST